jgi:hypothetical protein
MLSGVLDFDGLVIVSSLDCQRFLVEPESLSLSSVSGLDDNVSSINDFEVSSRSQLSNNVEISLNNQTEVFVELTLGWILWILVSIDKIPLLVESTMLVPHNDVSVLIISIAMNIHDLSSFVLKESSLISEELPPS